MIRAFLIILLFGFTSITALAQTTPNTPLSDTEIEAQAREIGHALRCVVCQNQSIEESDASLAEDMRTLVRARVRQGESKEEVIAYMQDRYGDYVLLKPPVQANTYVLWATPFVLGLLGLIWFLIQSKRTSTRLSEPLSDEEVERLKDLHNKRSDP